MNEPQTFTLPYPPTVNTYWRYVGGRVLLSKAGRSYRQQVALEVMVQQVKAIEGRLDVEVFVAPPDNQRRDLDNVCKGVLDSLAYAGVYEDDSQIDRLMIERHEPIKHGRLKVRISRRKGQ